MVQRTVLAVTAIDGLASKAYTSKDMDIALQYCNALCGTRSVWECCMVWFVSCCWNSFNWCNVVVNIPLLHYLTCPSSIHCKYWHIWREHVEWVLLPWSDEPNKLGHNYRSEFKNPECVSSSDMQVRLLNFTKEAWHVWLLLTGPVWDEAHLVSQSRPKVACRTIPNPAQPTSTPCRAALHDACSRWHCCTSIPLDRVWRGQISKGDGTRSHQISTTGMT